MRKKLILIFITAFFIRTISLNQSLWLDEATTANVVKNYPHFKILTVFSPYDFHPPVYYWFMKFWTDIFGYSEISLRFPSIIFSLITGFVIFKIVKELKSEKVAMWAVVLFLFNPLIIYYSQEARMYSLITLLITMIIYYLLAPRSSLERNGVANLKLTCPAKRSFPTSARSTIVELRAVGRPLSFVTRQLILCNLFIFLSFLTFYGSIFFIVSIYLYLLFKKQFKLLLYLLPGFVISHLLISPLLYQQFLNSKIAIYEVLNWSTVLGKANIKNLLLIPIKFSIGRISFEPKIFYYLISSLLSSFLFYFLLKPMFDLRGPTKKSNQIFLWLFFGPIILGFFVSFYTPLLQYFRFLYLIPIMIILIAVSVNKNWQKIIILSGFILFSLIYVLNPNFHREDWKSLVKSLSVSKPIYMILSSSDPIKYYNNKFELRDIKKLSDYNLENSIQVIPYSIQIHGVNYKEILTKKGYLVNKEKSFRELKTEIWTKIQ